MAKRRDHIIDYDSLRIRIENRQFEPIYLFVGEEDLLAEEGTRMIIDAGLAEPSSGFDLDVLYGPDSNARAVISVARSFPMMSERRIVVVRDFDHLASKELVEAYARQPSQTTSLILVASKPDLRTKPYPVLKETAIWVKCSPPRDNDIPGWIAMSARKRRREITLDACRLMQHYVGNALREIENELEKLFIFVGEKKEIDESDISEVVGMSRQYNIFELQKAIGRRDVKRSFEILERVLQAGHPAVMIVAALTRFFIKLYKIHTLRRLRVSEREIADAIKANPMYIKEHLATAEQHPIQHVEHCFAYLLEADEKLKSSVADHKLVMSMLVYKLVRG